jgi:formate dehydrogenase iron-sulfur subunit
MLRARGVTDAVVYDPRHTSVGGTHAIFLVRGAPDNYNLPSDPERPIVRLREAWQSAAAASLAMLVLTTLAFWLT